MSETSDKLRRWLKKSRSAGEINEMLVDICRNGDLEALKLLLDAGADVNAREDGESGQTPLLAACCWYKPDIVRALIAAGADVNAAENNIRHYSPLHYASSFEYRDGYSEIVRALIAAGADLNAKTDDGMTPLMMTESLEVAKVLIEAGADLEAKDDEGSTALLYAHGYRGELIQLALIEAGADVNVQDKYGMTPLIQAASEGELEALQALIRAGANVNAVYSEEELRKTALMFAISGGWSAPSKTVRLKAVRMLIAAGADVNAKDAEGKTALMYACEYGFANIVRALLKAGAGAEVKARTAGGWTAWLYAFCNQSKRTMERLVQAGAEEVIDVAAKDRLDRTPLLLASECGQQAAMRVLIEAGADVNAKDKLFGMTPLMYACEKRNAEAVQMLIAAGADVNAKDEDGRTALDMTRKSEIRDLLKNRS